MLSGVLTDAAIPDFKGSQAHVILCTILNKSDTRWLYHIWGTRGYVLHAYCSSVKIKNLAWPRKEYSKDSDLVVSKYLLIKGSLLSAAMNEQISCTNFSYFKHVLDLKIISFSFLILIQKIIDFFFLKHVPTLYGPRTQNMRVRLPTCSGNGQVLGNPECNDLMFPAFCWNHLLLSHVIIFNKLYGHLIKFPFQKLKQHLEIYIL